MEIPEGYQKIESGPIKVGDKMWAPLMQVFIDVTEEVLDTLGFLDAKCAEEVFCVVRSSHDESSQTG